MLQNTSFLEKDRFPQETFFYEMILLKKKGVEKLCVFEKNLLHNPKYLKNMCIILSPVKL